MAEAAARREAAAANFLAVQTGAVQEMGKAANDYRAALAEWAGADQTARSLQQELGAAVEQQVRAGMEPTLAILRAVAAGRRFARLPGDVAKSAGQPRGAGRRLAAAAFRRGGLARLRTIREIPSTETIIMKRLMICLLLPLAGCRPGGEKDSGTPAAAQAAAEFSVERDAAGETVVTLSPDTKREST